MILLLLLLLIVIIVIILIIPRSEGSAAPGREKSDQDQASERFAKLSNVFCNTCYIYIYMYVCMYR